LIRRFFLLCVLLMSPALFAQSVESAEGPGGSIWVGAEASSFNPDWGCTSNSPFSCWDHQLGGIAAFGDVNRLFGRVGVEGEARWSNWMNWQGTSTGVTQSNYLAGPRFQLISGRRLSLNMKVLAGAGTGTFNSHNLHVSGTWFAYAPGITLGYRLTPRFMVRGDYEYQFWTGFLGSGLTPNGFSMGVSYRLFR
jgi:Outer membrane protein beta-barrel domain